VTAIDGSATGSPPRELSGAADGGSKSNHSAAVGVGGHSDRANLISDNTGAKENGMPAPTAAAAIAVVTEGAAAVVSDNGNAGARVRSRPHTHLVQKVLSAEFQFFKRSITGTWVLLATLRAFAAPFYSVTFQDFFICDCMTSLSRAFLDLFACVCFYASGSPGVIPAYCVNVAHNPWLIVVSCVPHWLRAMQQLRRYKDTTRQDRAFFPVLANAVKYAMNMVVIILAGLRDTAVARKSPQAKNLVILWAVAGTVATLFSSYWDIVVDFSLFGDPNRVSIFKILTREQLIKIKPGGMIKKKWVYIVIAIVNTCLRFGWVLTISPSSTYYFGKTFVAEAGLVTFFAVIEVIRRFLWSALRIENEHIANVTLFKDVQSSQLL
jgi:hypothetical protein